MNSPNKYDSTDFSVDELELTRSAIKYLVNSNFDNFYKDGVTHGFLSKDITKLTLFDELCLIRKKLKNVINQTKIQK